MARAGKAIFWAIIASVLAADIVTKLAAERWLFRYSPIEVLGDFLQLRLVYNPGAAFGFYLGPHSRWIFLVLAIVALIVLGMMARATPASDRFRLVSLALVCGGAAGNVIDRLRSGQGVVDFIDVGVGTLRWPTFNVADSAVTCGAIALALSLWVEGRAARQAGAADSSLTSG